MVKRLVMMNPDTMAVINILLRGLKLIVAELEKYKKENEVRTV